MVWFVCAADYLMLQDTVQRVIRAAVWCRSTNTQNLPSCSLKQQKQPSGSPRRTPNTEAFSQGLVRTPTPRLRLAPWAPGKTQAFLQELGCRAVHEPQDHGGI